MPLFIIYCKIVKILSDNIYNWRYTLSVKMETMNKNKSNTTSTFRENDAVDNFQVENMRQKLKHAKKTKVRKSTNYKKIETFPTLTNVEETSMDKPLQEGFTDDEYEGLPAPPPPPPSRSITESVADNIEKVYKIITSFNNYLSTTITDALSGNQRTIDKSEETDYWSMLDLSGGLQIPDVSEIKTYMSTFEHANAEQTPDAMEIKDYLITIESVAVASYIVYNWYFLMYYAKDNAIDILQISLADLKSSDSAYMKILLFLFEYAVLIVSVLNNIVLNYIPKYITYYMNGSTRITLLFITLIYCVKHFASAFKDLLISSIKFEADGTIANILRAFVILAFFYTLVAECMQSSVNPTLPKPLIMQVFDMGMMASPFAIVGLIFYYIIRLLLIIFISLPAGCILTSIYIIFNSFFARIYYPKFRTTTYDDLDMHADGKSPIRFDDCDDGLITGWIKVIIYYIFLFFDSIKSNSFLLVLLAIVMSTSSSLYSNLSGGKSFIPGILFRDIIGMYNGIAIVVIISIIYAKFFNKLSKD